MKISPGPGGVVEAEEVAGRVVLVPSANSIVALSEGGGGGHRGGGGERVC